MTNINIVIGAVTMVTAAVIIVTNDAVVFVPAMRHAIMQSVKVLTTSDIVSVQLLLPLALTLGCVRDTKFGGSEKQIVLTLKVTNLTSQ